MLTSAHHVRVTGLWCPGLLGRCPDSLLVTRTALGQVDGSASAAQAHAGALLAGIPDYHLLLQIFHYH